MTANHLSDNLGSWPQDETDNYERAVDVYRTLLAAVNARIHAESDPAAVARWNADAARYVHERRRLDPTDHAAVRRVIEEYPALVRQIRASAPH